MPSSRALRGVAAVAVAAAALAGCSRETRADGTAFCEAVRTEQASLSAGVATPAQATAVVARYRELEKLAPLAVRDEWTRVADLLEAAASAPAGDAEAADALSRQALEAAGAVDDVTDWVRTTCGVDLRPGLPTSRPVPPAITAAPPPSG